MKKCYIFLFIFVASFMFAQIVIEFDQPGVTYNYFPISSLDPENVYMPFIFNFIITNETSDQIDEYELELTLSWMETGDIFTNQVLRNESDQPLSPNQVLMINSRDIFSEGSIYFDGSIDFADSFSDDFEDQVLALGALPDGDYTLNVKALINEVEVDEATFTLTILSPTPIQLIYPGNSSNINNEIFTTNPEFLWISNLTQYVIDIYEVDEENGELGDLEGVEPFFTDTPQPDGITNYIYPSDAPELEPGRTYAWQIKSGLQTIVEEDESVVESEVYYFKVSNEDVESFNMTMVENLLSQASPEIIEALQQLLNSGYRPSGKILYLNQEITIEDFQEILNKLATGEMTLKNIEIE